MDSTALDRYARSLPHYGGILAADQLPTGVVPRPTFFIVNTDPSNKPGRHWTVLYKDAISEFFDSAGLPPDHYGFADFLRPCYLYNSTGIQRQDSNTCGLYCLSYVLMKSVGLEFKTIVDVFSKNVDVNETIVRLMTGL